MIPFIDYDLCEGCAGCAETYPRLFFMRDGKAWVQNFEEYSPEKYPTIDGVCPFRAIYLA